MLIPYSTPVTLDSSGISISGFTLETTLAGLKDGRPGLVTVLLWPSGAQNLSVEASITVSWDDPIDFRVAGIASIVGLPEGTKVSIAFQDTVAGPFDVHPQESSVVKNVSGDLIVYDNWPSGLSQVYGARFTFSNDVNGSADIAAEQEVSIGELWVSDALELCAKNETRRTSVGGTVTELSVNGQPYDAIAKPTRQITVPINYEEVDIALGNDKSVEVVQQLLASNPRTFFSQYDSPKDLARKNAFYAKVNNASQVGLPNGARRYRSDWVFQELRG